MPKKSWTIFYHSLKIEVRNSWSLKWNLKMRTTEELFLNDVLVDSSDKGNAKDECKKLLAERLEHHASINNKAAVITAILGSKWHGLSIGCHIYINGILIGGDIHSKLLFTKHLAPAQHGDAPGST